MRNLKKARTIIRNSYLNSIINSVSNHTQCYWALNHRQVGLVNWRNQTCMKFSMSLSTSWLTLTYSIAEVPRFQNRVRIRSSIYSKMRLMSKSNKNVIKQKNFWKYLHLTQILKSWASSVSQTTLRNNLMTSRCQSIILREKWNLMRKVFLWVRFKIKN